MLPHDYLTWRLLAGPATANEPVTDRGDASGTGYFSPAGSAWLPEVAADALGHQVRLPRLAQPAEAVGETGWGAAVSAGTGDNMGAALGLCLEPGEIAVSIGTSGTAYAVTTVASADPSGAIAGFADATGRFLPLVCTINAALVLDSVAAMLGTDAAGLSARALAAAPGAGGITLLPYFDGERTPVRPGASRHAARPDHPQRHAREPGQGRRGGGARLARRGGQPAARRRRAARSGSCSLAAEPGPRRSARRPRASSAPRWTCRSPRSTWRSARPGRRPGRWPAPRIPPAWPRRPAQRYEGPAQPGIRERFAALRDATAGWDGGLPASMDS